MFIWPMVYNLDKQHATDYNVNKTRQITALKRGINTRLLDKIYLEYIDYHHLQISAQQFNSLPLQCMQSLTMIEINSIILNNKRYVTEFKRSPTCTMMWPKSMYAVSVSNKLLWQPSDCTIICYD